MPPASSPTPATAPAPAPAAARRASDRRFARLALAPSRVRFWGLLVPIHLGAFAALYFGTFALLERAYTQAASTAARFQLDEAVRDMPLLSPAEIAATGTKNPHTFARTLAVNHPIGLRLYRRDGTPLGAPNLSLDRAEQERVRRFLADESARSETWIETDAQSRQWVRGLVRLNAGVSCSRCHEAGSTRGAAAMRLDFTEPLQEIRTMMRWRIGWLLGAWLALIAGVAIFVQCTVRRSAARLEEELRATVAGEAAGLLPSVDAAARSGRRRGPSRIARSPHPAAPARGRRRGPPRPCRPAREPRAARRRPRARDQEPARRHPGRARSAARRLRRRARRCASTSEMLAELRRVNVILHRLLESGRPAPLRLARTDLGRLLAETSELLRPSLRRQRVELVTAAAAGLPALEIDPAKIRQVLVNLIQNAAEAIAATPGQGGRITVRASGFPAEAAVVVAVEDDGPGIPAEQLASVFEPFFTTKFTGTGLGLAISKSLVEQHGGRIEVTSEPGKGTSFLIILPPRPQAIRATREPPLPSAASSGPAPDSEKMAH